MIRVDLHIHTCASHAKDTVADMYRAGLDAGLVIMGFSEHSPRPLGYDYPSEYREHLIAEYPKHIKEVQALQAMPHDSLKVLLGIELDWFDDEVPFMENVVQAMPYDYVIGGLHFLEKWGFDGKASDWDAIDNVAYGKLCMSYYISMRRMVQSGLVNIVAHPDLIKIFTQQRFEAWLVYPENRRVVRDALEAMAEYGVSMEVSSAGLRKHCANIYPCPTIMHLAKDIGVNITFGSDSHCVSHVAYAFDELEQHARQAGFTESIYYVARQPHIFLF